MFDPKSHLIKLKGKDYLQVMHRLVWFREEHPDFGIISRMESIDLENKHAIFRAEITDATGRVVSSGYGSESVKDFGDYIEKAETKAVGRALAMLGYGTQFAPELDEGERIVDSPVAPVEPSLCADCGVKIKNGKKRDGSPWTASDITEYSKRRFLRVLCPACQKTAFEAENGAT